LTRDVKEPQQARSKDSTEQMLAAALDLMSEGGLSSVTIAAVSERSGQSNGTLYHRFQNRMALIEAAQAQFLDAVEVELRGVIERAADESDDTAAVSLVAREYVSLFASRRRVFRALLIEGQDFEGLSTRGRATSHSGQDLVIQWMRARFGTDPVDAAAAAYLLLSSAMTRVIFEDDVLMAQTIDDEALGRILVAAILRIVVG
jgi:AcrR family transcriptional regulator